MAMLDYAYLRDLYEQIQSQQSENIVEDYNEFITGLDKVSQDVIRLEHQKLLEPNVAAEIGTWIRNRKTEAIEGYAAKADTKENHVSILELPARDEARRTAVTQFALRFVETY